MGTSYAIDIQVERRKYFLGRWNHPLDAAIARDRASLYFGLERPLSHPKTSGLLGPASPEELRRLARASRKAASASSRFHGVWFNRKKARWQAQIHYQGGPLLLGDYSKEEQAAVIVDRVCKYLGLPLLNFPEKNLPPQNPHELRADRARALKEKTSSRYVGVLYRPQSAPRPWHFHVWHGSHNVCIGGYEKEKDAAVARDRAALHYFENPTLNFPDRARALGAADFETLRREAFRERKKSCSSQYRGVTWVKTCWVANISVDGKSYRLGSYSSEVAAAEAYDAAALSMLEPNIAMRRLNFPDPESSSEGARAGRRPR